MHRDFKELLSAFNAEGVRYLIVGGYAVSVHAQPRATKDLDILVGLDAKNSKALYSSLAKFGAPIEGLTARDFTEPDNFFRMGTPPVMVDIMPKISGVEFEEAWHRRVDVRIDDELTASFISRDDLVASKLAAGRAQDLADVDALHETIREDKVERQQHPPPPPMSARDELDGIQRKGREAWLKLRQKAGPQPTIEELQAKSRENWLRLRQKRAEENSQESQHRTVERDPDSKPKDSSPEPGFDDDVK
jgi:hypothetical protein